jgi:hypothetical protein
VDHWNFLDWIPGEGGRCSESDSNVVESFKRLKILEEGAPVGRWVSWILGRSSEIATRTGSRGRLERKRGSTESRREARCGWSGWV